MLSSLLTTLALGIVLPSNDSTVYTVLNHNRPAGTMVVWRSGDSARVRYVYTDRNRGTRIEVHYALRGDSAWFIEQRPVLADDRTGDVTSRLRITADSLHRWSRRDSSSVKLEPGDYPWVYNTPFDELLLAKHLLRSPNRSARTAKDTITHLEIVNETTVATSHGRERVRLVAMGTNHEDAPDLIWLDSHDDLFATEADWFMTVKPGAEPALPTLRRIESSYRDAAAEALDKRVRARIEATIVIRNGDVFDSEKGTILPHTTVIVRGDRIVAIGPADSVSAPANATVIDATGKTVMPGMWDMHGHLQTTSGAFLGPMQLSFGLTTVRDLGSDPDVAIAYRDAGNTGRFAVPRSILSAFIDGPGKWAGPTPNIVRTEDEARALVAHFDSLGYKQVKLYNLVHPDLVPTFAAEAHKRGMRLSGHVPRGLSVSDAVTLGFDEIQHAAFLFSTFYPDSLFVPTMRAYSLVATTVAPHIDVDGAPMSALIDFLKRHQTVIDGTFSVWVTSAGTGIAQSVGAGAPTDAQKADAAYMRLLRRLYDAGVPLVPGTDNPSGTSYNAELELYEQAGISAPTVLRIATIIPAQVMHDDRDYGSLAVGKVADIIVVNGRPAEHVKDLRKVEKVLRAGRLYEIRDLKSATGLSSQ